MRTDVAAPGAGARGRCAAVVSVLATGIWTIVDLAGARRLGRRPRPVRRSSGGRARRHDRGVRRPRRRSCWPAAWSRRTSTCGACRCAPSTRTSTSCGPLLDGPGRADLGRDVGAGVGVGRHRAMRSSRCWTSGTDLHGQGCGDKPVYLRADVQPAAAAAELRPDRRSSARAEPRPVRPGSACSSWTGTRTVSTSAAIRIRPRRPAASTIGSTAWLSARVVEHDLDRADARWPAGRPRPAGGCRSPRRCQAGSTRACTGRTPSAHRSRAGPRRRPTGWSSTRAVTRVALDQVVGRRARCPTRRSGGRRTWPRRRLRSSTSETRSAIAAPRACSVAVNGARHDGPAPGRRRRSCPSRPCTGASRGVRPARPRRRTGCATTSGKDAGLGQDRRGRPGRSASAGRSAPPRCTASALTEITAGAPRSGAAISGTPQSSGVRRTSSSVTASTPGRSAGRGCSRRPRRSAGPAPPGRRAGRAASYGLSRAWRHRDSHADFASTSPVFPPCYDATNDADPSAKLRRVSVLGVGQWPWPWPWPAPAAGRPRPRACRRSGSRS